MGNNYISVFRKWTKRFFLGLLVLIVLVNLFILFTGRTYIYKAIASTYLVGQSGPGIFDENYFHHRTVEAGLSQPWPQHVLFGKYALNKDQLSTLEKYSSTSFVVFKSDSLLFEWYSSESGPDTRTNSFSMAKSITSILIGIAIDEGKIKSLDQKVGDFLPAYKEGSRAALTIRHALSMTANLEWSESGANPLSENAESYYGSEIRGMMNEVELRGAPGKHFEYQSGATEIAGMVLEQAVGMTVSDYAAEKLWKKIGAEEKATWSLDHEEGMEKTFCCFYATSRDFARIGKLYMNDGRWGDEQIVSESYVRESLSPDGLPDEDGKPNKRYGLSWWVLDEGDQKGFYARGILGQYVICLPQEKLIIVRTGHKRGEKTPGDHPSDLYEYIRLGKEISGE